MNNSVFSCIFPMRKWFLFMFSCHYLEIGCINVQTPPVIFVREMFSQTIRPQIYKLRKSRIMCESVFFI